MVAVARIRAQVQVVGHNLGSTDEQRQPDMLKASIQAGGKHDVSWVLHGFLGQGQERMRPLVFRRWLEWSKKHILKVFGRSH